jgi:hypothetical protein
MPNTLVENAPRIGWFYDNLPEDITPATATMLLDDGERITLTIPWQDLVGESGQLSRWFRGNLVMWADDPDRTKYNYELPTELGFNDADGSVTLVGCRTAGYRSKVGGAAHGVVSALFAVMGATDLRWGKINALRTFIPELSQWTSLSAVTEQHTTDDEGRLASYSVSLASMPAIRLDRRLNLSLVSSWRVERGAHGEPHRLHDDVLIETDVRRPEDWATHLDGHRAVQQLLEVAAWRPFGIASIKAKRDADPQRVLSGEVVGPRWLDVHSHAVRPPTPKGHGKRPRFLFAYGDIGPAGVARWMRLRKDFSRGVLPIMGLHDVEKLHLESQLTQSCVGLEAIAYQLALETGRSAGDAKRLSFEERAELIRTTIDFDVIPTDWPSRAATAYNGFKHANRPLPDVESMYRAHRENLLVFRLWVALRIGVKQATLHSRLDGDPLAEHVRMFAR